MTLMLLTRPEPDAQASLQRLNALGIQGISEPLMVRQALETSLPPAQGFAAVALTSVNGLRALIDRGALGDYLDLPVYAVGARTAYEAESAGFSTVIDAGGTLEQLINILSRAELDGPVFYPAARHLSGDLAKALAPFGVMVVTARIYEMVAVDDLSQTLVDDIRIGKITAALFYSRRTAEIFIGLIDQRLSRSERSALAMLCFSESVAEPLMAAHFNRISLADRPDEEAMMTLALAFAREQGSS